MVRDTPTRSADDSAPRKTDAGPDIAPQDRDTMMQAHRNRRQGEPAAAPMETDAESGGASALADLPEGAAPDDPAKPYLDAAKSRESESHEVRAGPGDAGAQDSPEVLPKTPRTAKASAARIALWFVVPLAVLLALYWAQSL
jgi:hypothetical protein